MLGRGRGVQRDEHHSSILSIPLSPSSCSLSLYLEADPPPWALQSRVWQIQTRLSLLRSDMYGWAGLSVWGAAIGWTGGGGDSRAGVARGGHRFAYVRKQEGVTGQLMDINTVLLAIHQTPTNEGLQGWVGVDIKTGLVTLNGLFRTKVMDCLLMGVLKKAQQKEKKKRSCTLASGETPGLGGNCTSVALSIVFSCRMSCCDWLWPNG